jgi:hypothetical protein
MHLSSRDHGRPAGRPRYRYRLLATLSAGFHLALAKDEDQVSASTRSAAARLMHRRERSTGGCADAPRASERVRHGDGV